ncbi:MAG: hypothetical protein IT442_17680, partial [Phycisphaeraceae bacterium]|nr:hypothetical protein [Phycisphaeraceae bacterium]
NCAMAFALAAEKPMGWGKTFNVVDEHGVSAWEYVGVCMQRAGISGVLGVEARRLPVGYGFAHTMTRVAMGVARGLLGKKAKLPSILVPRRFEARFRPVRVRAQAAHEVLGWRPRLTWDDAVGATFGGEASVSAPSSSPLETSSGAASGEGKG